MTVSSTTSRVSYSGNGSTTAFAVSFYFLENTHLKVILRAADGTETVKALTTDYTVSGAGNPAGGTVTMNTAPATGTTLVIVRNVPLTQETDYQANDPFPAESHERALDKLTMEMQTQQLQLDRSIKVPATTGTNVSTVLPNPEMNQLIGWNESATGLQNIDGGTLATIVAYGTARSDVFTGNGVQTAFTLSYNPGSLNNLDVSIDGATQVNGVDFTWAGGTTLTMTTAVPNGSKLLVRYMQGLPTGIADADDVQYAPSGMVARTVGAKLRENVSVKDFGATPTNTSILNAVNEALTGGTVTISRSAHVNRIEALGKITAMMKAGGTVKIACYGDSTTDGNNTTGWSANPTSGGVPVGNSDHESTAPNAWPARLKTILRDMFSNNNIQVWNAGYSGQRMDTGWAFNNYDAAVTNNSYYGVPDVCFIAFGLNDITASTSVYADHLKYTLALCVKLIEAGTLPILLTCDAIQRNDPAVRDSEEATREIDSAKRVVANQLGIPVIEAGEAQRQWASNNSSGYRWKDLQNDDLHFGDLGHSFKAGFVAASMFPDLMLAEDGLEVVAQDPRWQLNSAKTWGEYLNSGTKSGRNYYATAAGGETLMTGWIWNWDSNLSLHDLVVNRGGSQGQPARARIDLLDTVSKATTTVQLSGPASVNEWKASDLPLVIKGIPVGLSKLTAKVKDGAGNYSSYSSDLLFLKNTVPHGSFQNLQIPSSITTSASGFKFFAPEYYRSDVVVGQNMRVTVNASLVNYNGFILWHSRAFDYGMPYYDGKIRSGLSIFRGSSNWFFEVVQGHPDGVPGLGYHEIVTEPHASFPANADGTYTFIFDLTWSSGIPTIQVKKADGTAVITQSLADIDVALSGPIGGLTYNDNATAYPVINSMSWGEL